MLTALIGSVWYDALKPLNIYKALEYDYKYNGGVKSMSLYNDKKVDFSPDSWFDAVKNNSLGTLIFLHENRVTVSDRIVKKMLDYSLQNNKLKFVHFIYSVMKPDFPINRTLFPNMEYVIRKGRYKMVNVLKYYYGDQCHKLLPSGKNVIKQLLTTIHTNFNNPRLKLTREKKNDFLFIVYKIIKELVPSIININQRQLTLQQSSIFQVLCHLEHWKAMLYLIPTLNHTCKKTIIQSILIHLCTIGELQMVKMLFDMMAKVMNVDRRAVEQNPKEFHLCTTVIPSICATGIKCIIPKNMICDAKGTASAFYNSAFSYGQTSIVAWMTSVCPHVVVGSTAVKNACKYGHSNNLECHLPVNFTLTELHVNQALIGGNVSVLEFILDKKKIKEDFYFRTNHLQTVMKSGQSAAFIFVLQNMRFTINITIDFIFKLLDLGMSNAIVFLFFQSDKYRAQYFNHMSKCLVHVDVFNETVFKYACEKGNVIVAYNCVVTNTQMEQNMCIRYLQKCKQIYIRAHKIDLVTAVKSDVVEINYDKLMNVVMSEDKEKNLLLEIDKLVNSSCKTSFSFIEDIIFKWSQKRKENLGIMNQAEMELELPPHPKDPIFEKKVKKITKKYVGLPPVGSGFINSIEPATIVPYEFGRPENVVISKSDVYKHWDEKAYDDDDDGVSDIDVEGDSIANIPIIAVPNSRSDPGLYPEFKLAVPEAYQKPKSSLLNSFKDRFQHNRMIKKMESIYRQSQDDSIQQINDMVGKFGRGDADRERGLKSFFKRLYTFLKDKSYDELSDNDSYHEHLLPYFDNFITLVKDLFDCYDERNQNVELRKHFSEVVRKFCTVKFSLRKK